MTDKSTKKTFYENYLEACKEKNKKPGQAVQEAGLSLPNIYHWKDGQAPSVISLHMLADYFGMTMDELWGRGL